MIGIDIVAIDRICKLKERRGSNFTRRFLSEDEMGLVKADATLAGFWAAKEAVSKALGCGIGAECSFFDIEIFKDAKNAPQVRLSQKVMQNFNVKSAKISISHDGGFAIAAAILE